VTTLGDKINQFIAGQEGDHGSASPLHGMGEFFVAYQGVYGINAAVVAGTIQKECQFGTVPDAIANTRDYNFGGNKCGAVGVTVATGCDGQWMKYPNAKAGLEGIFQTLNAPLYRSTDGTLGAVMNIYSPPWDNPDFWPTFAMVGQRLGVALNQSTKVYTKADPNVDTEKICETECEQDPTSHGDPDYLTCIEMCHKNSAERLTNSGLPSFDAITKEIATAGERLPFVLAGAAALGIGLWRVVKSG